MDGELKEDEALPSIRALAQDIKISVMTIKKAYDELESEGYIVSSHVSFSITYWFYPQNQIAYYHRIC